MIKGFVSLSILLFCLLSFSVNADENLPTRQLTPGGVAIIEIASAKQAMPTAKYRKKKVRVVQSQGKWVAVVGIPLSSKLGTHELLVKAHNTNNWKTHSFKVKDKQYTEQYLTIKNKRKVDPNAEDMKKIVSDRTIIANAKNHWSDEVLASRFITPVKGIRSSQFGHKRFFNKKPRRPHGGLDIAASKGTPVIAPADGIVVESGDFFFSGNCIFIDHGRGLQTFYAHLDKIHVTKGQVLKQGELIGEVGETGRVTGPHLHWSVGLNQTWVDPNLFLDD